MTQAEKRVINVLKYNEGSYIYSGFEQPEVLSKDKRRLIRFRRKTLRNLRESNLLTGSFPIWNLAVLPPTFKEK